MSDAPPSRSSDTPADDRAAIEAVVAECIEAMERGEQDPAARVCAARPDLLPRVRRRLGQLAARGLIDTGDGPAPDTIGPYRIVRELGIGGMGAVYLAEQAEPMRRLVALKLVKLGMDTREVVARFEKERQALALMSHPNIAQVFDAGITSAGRPFFVMEYVDGLGLLRFCDGRALGPEERVRLLATVARAVHHAHERGFVHRDLKPSNVLVAEHAGLFVPKVIDFGIAKAMTPTGHADADGPRTRTDELIGTPEYMSPEHAASGGLHVDARSDVYSLGAVLYELSCGEMPFDGLRLRRAARGEMERILHDELPTLPSRRLGRAADAAIHARGRERTSLRRRIAGELDWITLKALAKDPAHRYATALAFAEDLERWLRNQPVHAAPPARTYRLRKLVRRNRAVVAVSAVAAIATAGTWFAVTRAAAGDIAKVEAQAAADSAALADRLLKRANDPRIRNAPQHDEARRTLVAEALALYQECMRERPADVGLRQRRCNALITLSQVHWQLGQIADAERSGTAALAEARALLAERPDDLARRVFLAESARRAGRALVVAGRAADAKPLLAEAVEHLDACAAAAPDKNVLSFSSALRELASALSQLGEDAASLAAVRRSVDVLATFAAAGSKDPVVERDLCIARSGLASQLASAGQLDEAESTLARAAADLESLRTDRARIAVIVHGTRATLARRRDDAEAALVHLAAAVAAAEQWCADEPGRLQPSDTFGAYLVQLAEQQERLGRFDAANATMSRRITWAESARRAFPENTRRLPETLYQCAFALWDRYRRADLDQALAWAARARDEHAAIVANDASQQKDHCDYGTLLARIGDARGDDTAAAWEALARDLPVDAAKDAPGFDQWFDAWLGIGNSRLRHGRIADVAPALAQAEHTLRQRRTAAADATDLAWLRARLALASGDVSAAAAAGDRVLAVRKTWLGRWRAADCFFGAATVAAADDARAPVWRDQAAQLFRSVVDELERDVAADPLDPWKTLPWGFSGVQLARIRAATGDREQAQKLLDTAMPALERVKDLAHRDVWQDDVWTHALDLRRSLTEAR